MKKIILAVALVASAAVSAEMKIGTVNMLDLVQLHPSHESNRSFVKSTDADYKKRLDAKQDEAKKIADEGKKVQEDLANPMLSQAAKLEAQRKIEDVQKRFIAAQQELRAAAQHYQSELADMESRLLKIETDEIRKTIAEYAKKNGYDIIADSTMLAFAKDSLDVTDAILKAMKVDPAKRKELKKR